MMTPSWSILAIFAESVCTDTDLYQQHLYLNHSPITNGVQHVIEWVNQRNTPPGSLSLNQNILYQSVKEAKE